MEERERKERRQGKRKEREKGKRERKEREEEHNIRTGWVKIISLQLTGRKVEGGSSELSLSKRKRERERKGKRCV